MHASPLKRSTTLIGVASVLLIASPVFAGEKLKVFILAGQSNMVGHARAHTIATLYHSDDARDKALVELVFEEDSGISKEMLEEQLALGRKIDELTDPLDPQRIQGVAQARLEVESVDRDGTAVSRLRTRRIEHDDAVVTGTGHGIA